MSDNNITVDIISETRLDKLATMEKIRLILDRVKEDKIVVLQGNLEPEEQSQLVQTTMSEISSDDPDGFKGLEIETQNQEEQESGGLFSRITGNNKNTSAPLTIIGPANRVEAVNDQDIMSAIIER